MGRQILADAPMNRQEIVPRLTWNSVPDDGFSFSLYFKSIIWKNLDRFLDALNIYPLLDLIVSRSIFVTKMLNTYNHHQQ